MSLFQATGMYQLTWAANSIGKADESITRTFAMYLEVKSNFYE